jgi:hypothetical protein
MNFTHHTAVAEQIVQLQHDFVRDVCQVADSTVNEMFYNPQREEVMLSVTIEGDDGRSYERLILISLEDEEYEQVNRSDYMDALGFIDVSNEIPAL